MSSQQLDEERIFQVARTMDDPVIRSEYFEQVCAGDQSLRERVEALLEAHEQDRAVLESNHQPAPTVDHSPLNEHPGQQIGRYKLMEQIGEGGMGVVFVAEQRRPVQRKVALKVIKPGMDSKAVIARFEAERQALAMMDHPNIAKVLDAGTTDAGRPYFAMELVKGVPVTEYCDLNRLTIRQRLELFTQVCRAIQHAHQKGIIHRDIKPSNVLVTMHDGKPVAKVIDFGVAKALNARLTDRTIYTEHLQVIGTLMYMSPEQAEFSGLDVDTRSDIYSLGVLLYELLTGSTPFDKKELESAGLEEKRRIIREQDPPLPSVRISSLGETATAIAESRKTDRHRLNRLLQRDLDWILLKALDKDRSRRYETSAQLAEDLNRYLRDEPVAARRPSSLYRMRKFVRRNRLAVSLSLAVVAAIVVCMATFYRMHLQQARTQRYFATSSAVKQLVKDHYSLRGGDELRAEEKLLRARSLLEDYPIPPLQKTVHGELGYLYVRFHGDFVRGMQNYRRAVELELQPSDEPRDESHYWFLRGVAERELGLDQDAIRSFTTAVQHDQRALPRLSRPRLGNQMILAGLHFEAGNFEQAVRWYEPYANDLQREVDQAKGTHRRAGRIVFLTRFHLAQAITASDPKARELYLQRAFASAQLPALTGRLVDKSREMSKSLNHLIAAVELTAGRRSDAVQTLQQANRDALDDIRKGTGSHYSMSVRDTRTLRDIQKKLVELYAEDGRLADVERLLRDNLSAFQLAIPADHHHLAYTLQLLGEVQGRQGEWEKALDSLARAEGRFASFGKLLREPRIRCVEAFARACQEAGDTAAAQAWKEKLAELRKNDSRLPNGD